MTILTSETMKHGTLVLPAERARFFINLLGKRSALQFEDMNSHTLRRNFRKFVQRIEELERIIRSLQDELERRGEPIIRGSQEEFLEICDSEYKLEIVEGEITRIYQQFCNFRDNNATLISELNAAMEESAVCRAASAHADGDFRSGGPGLLEEGANSAGFSNMAGVIFSVDKERFARTIFRATRGNTFCDFSEISEPLKDPKTGQPQSKVVFLVFYQGRGDSAISGKIQKIAQSFSAHIYAWPRDRRHAEDRVRVLGEILTDKAQAISAYEKFLEGETAHLLAVSRSGGSSLIEEWRWLCAKEKAIYATLNLFEGEQTLRSDCWFPEVEEDSIRRLLQEHAAAGHVSAMLLADHGPGTLATPPTFIKTNAWTRPFQDLVDTYGIPRYKEVNPALFTTVTFPFLFGVMFGDIGHGSMLLLVGLWAVAQGKSLQKSIPQLFYARYLILAMGIAATYAGFIYSEFFSIGVNLFGSNFECFENGTCESDGGTYPFGLDPSWAGASNMLLFVNSMKMKLAVLFGVTQMIFGVALKFVNSWNTPGRLELFCECIPQMAFLVAVFGYMDFMIVYKWTHVNANMPSLISAMINMGLMFPIKESDLLFPGQQSVQSAIMMIAAIAIPWMLIPKPLILWARHRFGGRNGYRGRRMSEDVNLISGGHSRDDDHGEKFELGEILIHQVIETIEFVLGSVSHTASYLRLWALSLAHQQLSIVFIKYLLFPSMSGGWWFFNSISIFIHFPIFLNATVGILLGMDTLECFLHTLRLHWVEFQSKFFKGDGVRFDPFSHAGNLLKNAPPSSE